MSYGNLVLVPVSKLKENHYFITMPYICAPSITEKKEPVDEGQKQRLVTDINVAIEVGISQRIGIPKKEQQPNIPFF